MFALAKAAGPDLDDLGARMMARKQEPTAEIEAKGLPTLKTRSVTGHELEESRPVR